MATKRVRQEHGMQQDQEPEAGFEDQISELPDAIFLHMIPFLPILNAAIRRSLLSKRWRRMWTLVPVLDFHDLRDIPHFGRHDSRNNDWCKFLENKNVKELDFLFIRKFLFGPYLISYFHLRELALLKWSGLSLSMTLVPSSLPSPKESCFDNIKMDDLTNLLLGCPSLEELNMYDWHGLSNPKVSSLSLKSMEFRYCFKCRHSDCRTVVVEAINLHLFVLRKVVSATTQISVCIWFSARQFDIVTVWWPEFSLVRPEKFTVRQL